MIVRNFFGRRLPTSDSIPKNFEVERATVRTFMVYSELDALADIKDVNRLIPMLTGMKTLRLQKLKNYNHMDFVQSMNAHKDIYPNILNFFNECATCEV